MNEDLIWDAVSATIASMIVFTLLLVVPAIIYERWLDWRDRKWIRRLQDMERGREQQGAKNG